MKLFACGVCGQPLMFENTACVQCGHRLGYDVASDNLLPLDEAGSDLWRPASGDSSASFRFCANAAQDVCNWLVPAESDARFCRACRHNRTIPDLNDAKNLPLWRELEWAKHRLFYTLVKLGLPLVTRQEDPQEGLAFDFLTDDGGQQVLTGHEHGIITLNAKEADDAHRVTMKERMGEVYRTLLGHFRHEIGHWYWDRLVRDGAMLDEYRATFGDERDDYDAALKKHYAEGPSPDWRDHFISAYATTHSWEDFAETFAHYLHIVDTLETARSFGIAVHARETDALDTEATLNPYKAGSMDAMLAVWSPIAFAVNALNRSMGQPDLYPFVLPPDVVRKLEYIRKLVATSGRSDAESQRKAA